MQSLMLMQADFTLVGELPQYVSLQLNRSFWEVGSFKLTLKRGMPCWNELKRERLLYFPMRPEVMLWIERMTVDEEKVVADGVPLKGLAKRRICVPPQVSEAADRYMAFGWDRFTGDAESAYLHYAANNLTEPEDEKRRMPGLVLGENLHRGKSLPWQARFDKLTDIFEEIGMETGIGWDIRPDFMRKQFVFAAWAGVDRTGTAMEKPGAAPKRAALSRRLGNVDGTTLTDNGSAEVSTLYAGGSGNDEQRLILSVGNELAGFARREGWTEMSGVEDIEMLRAGARRKLAAVKLTLDVELRDSGLCRYGRDYDLGDLVTVEADGAMMNARLIGVQETLETRGRRLKATFGDAPVTLTRLLKGRTGATENIPGVRTEAGERVEGLTNNELAEMLK